MKNNTSSSLENMKNLDFETALLELEMLVSNMEQENITLEDSLSLYRRGVNLVRFCQNHIAKAEETIKVLDGELLKPLDSNELGEE
ncbi:exodeoxyribonuclease VII small subunit [Candidatus Kinetoplastidibacterium crithidiae]|uniref:Exodeoxyribonuclease 7 small subunit n=1 Tax=Candidatus Kinetoplastidibacterium crithidiae TCC036E TaxID=1208918 RepID=M1M6D8_9PROT|nr:exodeoxyribonuclease VII small subunit [Candidatus Kinetoplastibacterium crithidii]AFZ82678.1 exodeoxyribonuclease VII small subunit [Candidatus Kinetoplastibacterium crithidii (ex Angomonas deanei ATCC 30255)]AGF47665.1 exodeoxyribonuclease VII small subunit [Candidatus Kinetoplastibacterium crithidii TCC036E]